MELTWRDKMVESGLIDLLAGFHRHYFQLEVMGEENLPGSDQGNVLFVMNHTAVFGLEVQLLITYLLSRRSSQSLRILVWPGYLNGPLGRILRSMGCEEASIAGGATQLKAGRNVLIMPEGVGATDVRQRFHHFHTGYLRMLKEAPRPVIPVGFFGVDQSIPWIVLQNRHLAKHFMAAIDPSFDFIPIPKLPLFRPVKVVLNMGRSRMLNAEDLCSEDRLQKTNDSIRNEVIRLAQEAEQYRQASVRSSWLNSLYHRCLDGNNSIVG